ncbi:MAG TPA: polysaccharide deacetylase family protein [Blastocatellia bacterium]
MTGVSKREMAARILGGHLAGSLGGLFGGGLRILAYHRVLNDDPASFPYDGGVISCSTRVFEEQVSFVAKNFDVISFNDLRAFEDGRIKLPGRPLVITFDDGYVDNYTNAFPVLKRAGISATIFLAAGYIGKDQLFWWDAVAYAVKHSRFRSVVLPQISPTPIQLESAANKQRAVAAILQWIKGAPDASKNRLVEDLPQVLGVDLNPARRQRMQLSWDEVREMAACNIEFGSHTLTHPILSNVAPGQLEREIAGSKKLIEKELNKEIIAFAYPVGGKHHFNPEVAAAVAQTGYRYAVSYINGVPALDQVLSPSWPSLSLQECTGHRSSERFSMSRIHVEAADSMRLFRANLMFPGIMLGSAV